MVPPVSVIEEPSPEILYSQHLEAMQGGVARSRFFEGFDCWYRSLLPEDRRARTLDFGCGRGDFLAYLRSLGYSNLEGFDVIASFAATIERESGALLHISREPIPFFTGRPVTYDVIFAKDVLEHLPPAEMQPLLEAMHGSLKPGGRIVVSGPHAAALTGLYTRYLDFTHTTCFTVASLSYLLQSAGFSEPQSVRPRRRFGIRPRRWLLAALRTLWFGVLRLIYFIESPRDPGNPPHFYNRIVVWASRR